MTTALETHEGWRLTEWAENRYLDWYRNSAGCSCFISPPCGHCTHEGNPANLNEAWGDAEAGVWEREADTRPFDILKEMLR